MTSLNPMFESQEVIKKTIEREIKGVPVPIESIGDQEEEFSPRKRSAPFEAINTKKYTSKIIKHKQNLSFLIT